MNMKKILFIAMLAAGLTVTSFAQTVTPYSGDINVQFPDYMMEGGNVTFTATVDFSQLEMSRKMMLEYVPVLRSTRSQKEVRFAPVVVTGSQRARVISRAEYFGEYTRAQQPSEIVVVKRKGAKTANVSVTVPFEKWMRYSELTLVETCTACCNDRVEYGAGVTSRSYIGHPYVFPEPYKPQFAVSFATPEIEPVKTRSDSYTARLSFQSGKSTLLRDFSTNASVLAEADKTISELVQDPLFTINAIEVRGYASPDGYMGTNQQLSDARAKAFVDYLTRTHSLRAANIRIYSQGMGEDWAGLRSAVAEASSLEGQQAVLEAIDNVGDIAKRKTAIWAINGKRTYKEMLADFYPPLRRNEYTIDYSVRSFNTEEAVEIYRTRPELLNLNELFMVASTMKDGSGEFNDVFDYAARRYPDSPIAQYNRATADVKNGLHQRATRRLENIEGNPISWNSLGVAYWHMGEHDKALEYFKKAELMGEANAPANLAEYQKWFDDKD